MILAHPVVPKADESLTGFLMRAAQENHLTSMAVMQSLLGRVTRPPDIGEVTQLAVRCRCSARQIGQLFGFRVRREDGERCWRLGSEWITKSVFVSTRSVAVCSYCLREAAFVPGKWELAFYRTCAIHCKALIAICPGCRRRLRWTRPEVCTCGCGFDLRTADSPLGTPSSWITAQLVEYRLDENFRLTLPPGVPPYVIERLAMLTLDGLFKTIWFLGHCVAEFERCGVGHGRSKPKEADADLIIERCFLLLARWPQALEEQLSAIARRPLSDGRASHYERMFGPITSYLEHELDEEQFAFLRIAFERHVRTLWRQLGPHKLPRHLDRQMEFDFET